MIKTEFLQRYKLFQLSPLVTPYLFDQSKPKKAAVLLALVDIEQQLHVILTKRAAHLKHHPGQISFPGGKVEKSDRSIIETALREAEEEIGLPATNVKVLGQLNAHHTVSGFDITPVIAMVNEPPLFIIDKNEVSEVFLAPLSHFLNSKNHVELFIYRDQKRHKVNFMPFAHYNIWGATAAILKELVDHLKS